MGKMLTVKVQEKKNKNSVEYKNTVNIADPNLVLEILYDLQVHGLSLEKVFTLYSNKQRAFPI